MRRWIHWPSVGPYDGWWCEGWWCDGCWCEGWWCEGWWCELMMTSMTSYVTNCYLCLADWRRQGNRKPPEKTVDEPRTQWWLGYVCLSVYLCVWLSLCIWLSLRVCLSVSLSLSVCLSLSLWREAWKTSICIVTTYTVCNIFGHSIIYSIYLAPAKPAT